MAPLLLRFVQLLPAIPPSDKFLLRDLPGSGKRIDLLCRDLAACFDWGPHTWPKNHLEFVALFANQVSLTIKYPESALPRGEVAWAEIIKQSFAGEPPEFVTVNDENTEQLIERLVPDGESKLWVLHEDGEPLDNGVLGLSDAQYSFMLGDHRGFDSQTEESIRQHGLTKASLGPTSYLSSHCVAAIVSKFERIYTNASQG
jgi:tRNA pseudouridine-54 N-methylase